MLEKIKQALEPTHVKYDGLVLPPKSRRLGSMPRKTDEQYVKYASGSVGLLEKHAGFARGQRLLDVGCGPGRVLIGLQRKWGEDFEYHGLDVDPESIRWASEYLANPPAIQFDHIDVYNSRYFPQGTDPAANFEFPVPRASFDVAALFSVFSHMWLKDIETYLRALQVATNDSGRVFCTLFTEDNVPQESENPKNYLSRWKGPMHCIRINRSAFLQTVDQTGWAVTAFEHRAVASGQSIYVLSKGRD